MESDRVKELIKCSKCSVKEVMNFVDEHTDKDLIYVRADLKEYIGKYGRINQVWAFFSICVAIGVVVFPSIMPLLARMFTGANVDLGNILAGVTSIILIFYMIFFMRPFRIGSYYRALSMLDDCCKLKGRIF